MSRHPFHDPSAFAFVAALEARVDVVRAELEALGHEAFTPSPDSLTTRRDDYDETGWLYVGLGGEADDEVDARARERCPRTVAACEAVPGVVNFGFSKFLPGTHLYPHRGERTGVLRCHVPLVVPTGDVGLRIGDETRHWVIGRGLVFDDTFEHDAWNRGDGERVVLLVTFRP